MVKKPIRSAENVKRQFLKLLLFFYVKRNSIALLSCRSVAPGLKIFGWTTVKKIVSNLQLSFPFQGDFDKNSVNWAGPSSPCKGYFLYNNLKVRWKCWSWVLFIHILTDFVSQQWVKAMHVCWFGLLQGLDLVQVTFVSNKYMKFHTMVLEV